MNRKKYKKETIINDIQKTLDYPILEIQLGPDQVEFLESFAENRKAYIESNFTKDEGKLVRKILDKLLSAYSALYEKTEYDYACMVNGLLGHSTIFRERKEKVRDLADKVHIECRGDWPKEDKNENESNS